MKAKKIILTAVAVQLLATFSATAVEKNHTEIYCQQEQVLVLRAEDLHGEKVVKVSFNGESSGIGTLSVYDAKGNMVYFVEEFELIAQPYFSAISVNNLPSGELTFVVSTKVSNHKAVINL